MKKAIQILLFLIIFIILFYFVSNILMRKGYINTKKFYNQPKNSINVMFFGSSHNYETINPLIVWDETKISSYVLGSPLQPIQVSYYYIKEAMKTQKLDLVVLETFLIRLGETKLEDGVLANSIDPIKLSLNKIEMINAIVPKEERINYYFNIGKYHDRWREIKDLDFDFSYLYELDSMRGYTMLFGNDETFILDKEISTTDDLELYDYDIDYLYKIIELCRKNNIELMLFEAPFKMDEINVKISNSIKKISSDKNIKFVGGYDLIKILNLNESDFYNKGHLNYVGAEKVSRYIANYIDENFEINKNYSKRTIETIEKDFKYYLEIKNRDLEKNNNIIEEEKNG